MIIYKIENKINGKIYIGQTTKEVGKRITTHLKINKYPIQKALNKHSLDSFIISVIDKAINQNDLDEKEKYWIRFYGCRAPKGYNCTDGGDGVRGYKATEEERKRNSQVHIGKKASEATKQKMRMAQIGKRISDEQKRKLSIAMTGKHFSEEHRRKLSILKTGKNHPNYGKHLSEETRRKIGTANSQKRRLTI